MKILFIKSQSAYFKPFLKGRCQHFSNISKRDFLKWKQLFHILQNGGMCLIQLIYSNLLSPFTLLLRFKINCSESYFTVTQLLLTLILTDLVQVIKPYVAWDIIKIHFLITYNNGCMSENVCSPEYNADLNLVIYYGNSYQFH